MRKPTLHSIGIFHTLPTDVYSHCAFTQKVVRFVRIAQLMDWPLIDYTNGDGSKYHDGSAEIVPMLSEEEIERYCPIGDNKGFHGNYGAVGSPQHTLFEDRLISAMRTRVQKGDIILHHFGPAHPRLVQEFPDAYHVEPGIGYPECFLPYRIYESYAWMHYHAGKESAHGSNYHFVIPNTFDTSEWDISKEHDGSIVFFGRITQNKGIDTVGEIAQRVYNKVFICGQGDPEPYLEKYPKLRYLPPVHGRDRSALLGSAMCTLMPTLFVEPFGGSGIEGMLCGTPLISVDYGAFTETVQNGVNGFRCKTLLDWIEAVQEVRSWGPTTRELIAESAREKYSLERGAELYERALMQIANLRKRGWYTGC